MKDYYKILEVEKKATQKDIKSSFRKLALKYHPDKNPNDKSAEGKMVSLNEAYAILGNESLRKEYDKPVNTGNTQKKSGYPYQSDYEEKRRSEQYHNAYSFENFDEFMFRTMDDLFDNHLGSLFGIKSKGEDLNSAIYLSFDEAVRGCRKKFKFERVAICSSCFGNSAVHDYVDCPLCRNHGKVLQERNLFITIPPKTPHLGRIRLKQEGSDVDSEMPGDLILEIHVTPDGQAPINTGLDEHIIKEISLSKAIHGGPVVIKGPTGPIRINTPAYTFTGKRLRVKDEGHLDTQTMRRGHLFVKFIVNFPLDPTRTELDQIERLEEKRQKSN